MSALYASNKGELGAENPDLGRKAGNWGWDVKGPPIRRQAALGAVLVIQ
jgi:hypothetical protein